MKEGGYPLDGDMFNSPIKPDTVIYLNLLLIYFEPMLPLSQCFSVFCRTCCRILESNKVKGNGGAKLVRQILTGHKNVFWCFIWLIKVLS